jgi:hypothetical protein
MGLFNGRMAHTYPAIRPIDNRIGGIPNSEPHIECAKAVTAGETAFNNERKSNETLCLRW